MKNIIRLFIICSLIMCSLASCNNWLDVKPESEVAEEDMFSTEQGYEDALYGVYTNLGKADLYGGTLPTMLDVMAHSLNVHPSNVFDYIRKYKYFGKSKSIIDKVWERLYHCVMLCDNILIHLEEEDPNEFEYYDYLKGESLALRAFIHYEILKIYAPNIKDKPDYMSIPYKKLYSNDIEPQKTVKEVINLILDDLNKAKDLLKDDVIKINKPEFLENKEYKYGIDLYASTFMLDRKFRMNYYAVLATLARVYMDKGDLIEAEKYAKEVVNSKKFRPLRLEDFKNESNKDLIFNDELIFGLFSTHIDTYAEAHYFMSGSIQDRVYIAGDEYWGNDDFADFFDIQGDIRILLYQQADNYDYGERLLIRHNAENEVSKQKIRMITLHEMYMILAECDPKSSIDYLKVMADARMINLPITVNSTDDEIMKYIGEEYRREYIGDGQMWYFFKRNKNKSFINLLNTGIGKDIKNLVLPLPEMEIEHGKRKSEIWK